MAEKNEKAFSNTVINWYVPPYGKPVYNSHI